MTAHNTDLAHEARRTVARRGGIAISLRLVTSKRGRRSGKNETRNEGNRGSWLGESNRGRKSSGTKDTIHGQLTLTIKTKRENRGKDFQSRISSIAGRISST
jgi:hypothetical protein